MDWNKIYKEKVEELNKHRLLPNSTINDVVHQRSRRFKSNYPTKAEHFSELEFLILNYDNSGELFKKFHSLMSEDTKSKLLIKKQKSIKDSQFNINDII